MAWLNTTAADSYFDDMPTESLWDALSDSDKGDYLELASRRLEVLPWRDEVWGRDGVRFHDTDEIPYRVEIAVW